MSGDIEPEDLISSLSRTPDDAILTEFAKHISEHFPSDASVAAALARTLADSGQKIRASRIETADVASTGGPSSLSTILCPLFLRAAQVLVPKLGVPGRPAGGIDCLAQLPGYRSSISSREALRIVESSGYAHFLAGTQFAPLDARLFRARQIAGYQAVPTLVAASLLSKKLAVGVKHVGLDVRVSPFGNFGVNWPQAQRNGHMLADAAKTLDIHCVPVLTDGRHAIQPFLGRKESLLAVYEVFRGSANAWLLRHVHNCRSLAASCLPEASRHLVAAASLEDLRRIFATHLAAQGSSFEAFEVLCESTRRAHTHVVTAGCSGFYSVDLERIRATLVHWQASAASATGSGFPDPLGVTLLHEPGSWVNTDEPIATLRIDSSLPPSAADSLRHALGTPSPHVFAPGIEAIHV